MRVFSNSSNSVKISGRGIGIQLSLPRGGFAEERY